MDNNELVNTGTEVTAMTYPSVEYDTEAEEVNGILFTRPSPFGSSQCYVNGIQVDPSTVKNTEDDEDDTEDQLEGDEDE